MMLAMKSKQKQKARPKPTRLSAKLKDPADYTSSEDEAETIAQKWEKIEARTKKRSHWGDDSATLEVNLPKDDSSDDEDDRNPSEEGEGEGMPLLSQFSNTPRTPDSNAAVGGGTGSVFSPYHLSQAPSERDSREPTQFPKTLTEAGPASLDEAAKNYQSWAEYFIAKGQPFPRDFVGLDGLGNPTGSPEVQVVATKPATENNEPVAKKKKTRKPDLSPAMAAFRFDHRDRLILGEELNPRNRENPGPYTVAQYIEFGSAAKGNYLKADLRELGSEALRKLASNFGCKAVSSASMFECRLKMAVRKTAGTTYGNLDIPNPATTAAEKRVSTQLRVLTAVFLPQFVNKFIRLNDTKGRAEMEATSGQSPYKVFWKDISATVNDPEQDPLIKTLFDSLTGEEEGADPTLRDIVMNGNYNLSDYNQVDWKVCAQSIRDVFKAFERIEIAMKQSGIHCTDTWQYCRKTFLKVRKGVQVPAVAAYYLSLLCKMHPGIQGNFAQCLEDHLKSDSTTSPVVGDGNTNTSALTSRTKNADSAAFLEQLEKTSVGLQGTARADYEQRQKLIDLQLARAEDNNKTVEDSRIAAHWKEYDTLSVRVLSLKKEVRKCFDDEESHDTQNYLFNLATRVRALEIELEIEEENSIVFDYLKRESEYTDED